MEKRRAARKAQHKKHQIAKRDHNDNRNKRQKAGGLASPPMNTCCLSHRGAEMSPVRRSTRATCRGRPRRRLPAALKCHRRASRRRLGATRPWARSRVRRLPPSERTSGRSAPVRCPAGWVLPSRRDLRPAKSIPREGRRSGRRPPASFVMALTAPTQTPCRGAGRGGGRRTRRRHRARRQWWSQALPRGACNRCLSGVAEPWRFMCPSSPAGATVQPRPLRRPGISPRASGGEYFHR
jgi:hypothetical protein